MVNINPTILEYGLLIIAFISVTALMVTGSINANTGVPILTGIITYGVGSAKGASTVNAVLQATTSNSSTSGASGNSGTSGTAAQSQAK